jgi:hypothetical protein
MAMLSSACATPRVVSTSGCAWVRPIVLTDDELIVFAANIHAMRSLADQINAQNTTRTEKCR